MEAPVLRSHAFLLLVVPLIRKEDEPTLKVFARTCRSAEAFARTVLEKDGAEIVPGRGWLSQDLKLKDFVANVPLLNWAKNNGCPWDYSICSSIARGGFLSVLKWAFDHRALFKEGASSTRKRQTQKAPDSASVCFFVAQSLTGV